ncbi:MAG: hypothetical protein ACRD9Q_02120, partial [Nitrososphaeraceae archaeon]
MSNNDNRDRVPLWLSRLLQYSTLGISIMFLVVFVYWEFLDSPHIIVKYSSPVFKIGESFAHLRDAPVVKSGDHVFTIREICSDRLVSVTGHRVFVSKSTVLKSGTKDAEYYIASAVLPTVSTV